MTGSQTWWGKPWPSPVQIPLDHLGGHVRRRLVTLSRWEVTALGSYEQMRDAQSAYLASALTRFWIQVVDILSNAAAGRDRDRQRDQVASRYAEICRTIGIGTLDEATTERYESAHVNRDSDRPPVGSNARQTVVEQLRVQGHKGGALNACQRVTAQCVPCVMQSA